MPKHQKQKGNPASKRMGNANLKARRARGWANAAERKKANLEKQMAQAIANKVLRDAGLPTPWEQARAERARRRGESLAKRRGREPDPTIAGVRRRTAAGPEYWQDGESA